MSNQYKRTAIIGMIISTLFLVSLACGSSSEGDKTNSVSEIEQTVQANNAQLTIAAQAYLLTQQAEGQADQPTTPEPPAAAPGTELPTIIANIDTNCRAGPSPDYPVEGFLSAGQGSTVHGKEPSGNWWYIENPKVPGEYCWVWAETTKVDGDVANLPDIEPSPLPEPEKAPAQTEPPQQEPPAPVPEKEMSVQVEFHNTHACGSDSYAVFRFTNFGDYDVVYASLFIKDKDTQEIFSQGRGNAPFMANNADCPPGKLILKPGEKGYLAGKMGGQFLPVGIKWLAEIKICSQPDGQGECKNYLIDFEPK